MLVWRSLARLLFFLVRRCESEWTPSLVCQTTPPLTGDQERGSLFRTMAIRIVSWSASLEGWSRRLEGISREQLTAGHWTMVRLSALTCTMLMGPVDNHDACWVLSRNVRRWTVVRLPVCSTLRGRRLCVSRREMEVQHRVPKNGLILGRDSIESSAESDSRIEVASPIEVDHRVSLVVKCFAFGNQMDGSSNSRVSPRCTVTLGSPDVLKCKSLFSSLMGDVCSVVLWKPGRSTHRFGGEAKEDQAHAALVALILHHAATILRTPAVKLPPSLQRTQHQHQRQSLRQSHASRGGAPARAATTRASRSHDRARGGHAGRGLRGTAANGRAFGNRTR